MHLLVINGPNLDLLGTREPEVYGTTTLSGLESMIAGWAERLDVDVEIRQSNAESEIIGMIHHFAGDGIVINPGAFTHTSRAIADAIRGTAIATVEIHISNVLTREPWRAVSVIAEASVRTIYGRGVAGYRDAMRHLVNRAAFPFETIAYGPDPSQVGDLRRGGGGLVVLAHGGLWRPEYGRDLTESLAVDLSRKGYDTWNIEYRRIGLGGGWPGSAHDVLMALDHIPQLGMGEGPVVVVGHSAGSHLLMWAASRTTTPVTRHIALAPLLDLEAAIAGGTVGAADSRVLLGSGAPPRMTPDGIDTMLVHGDTDQIVPVDHSVAFAAGHHLDLHRTGCDHFSLLDPTKPEWEWVLARIGPPL
ncbi:MAG TPA: type II 3-dehydroquinate dehydratase [Acidimicrobiia bacterium]|nr:type II 3-dehydroquinate dehydratase [Acidimicrobiia bacterium]